MKKYVDSIKNKDIDGIDDNAKILKDLNITCDSLSISCSILCDAMAAYYIAISPWTGGASWAAVGLLVLTSAADAVFAGFEIANDIALAESTKKLTQCRKEWDLIESTFTDKQIDQICTWDENLTDPKYNINSKLAIYDDLMTMKDSIGTTKWNNFETTVGQIYGMDSDMIQQYEQFFNDPNTDPTYLAAGRSVMYSLFAATSLASIGHSVNVLITMGKLAEEDYINSKNMAQKVADATSIVEDAEEADKVANDVSIFCSRLPATGSSIHETLVISQNLNIAKKNLKTAKLAKEATINEQKAANSVATPVAPEIMAFITAFGIVATTVEMLADHFLE